MEEDKENGLRPGLDAAKPGGGRGFLAGEPCDRDRKERESRGSPPPMGRKPQAQPRQFDGAGALLVFLRHFRLVAELIG